MAKILIVEDQKLLCQLYGSVLSKARHDVVLTYTGEEAVEEALRDRPDLVIMDLKLPGISGVEVARKLLDSGILPAAPLIIATALGEEAQPIAQSFNAKALLPKPFHIDSMIAAVQQALAL
jgi:two-component system, OmpR family, phosphate regulon response regulator PhoB